MVKTTNEEDLLKLLQKQKDSLSTLLNNMPAMTFTKDVETGVYLACNQAFADFAGRKTPEEVTGLTDFEIFDHAVAEHFVQDDRKALAMGKPYVLYEDVSDAGGSPRQFQTTKLKFHDESGRKCLLGMSVDMTEMERIKREREREKAEYRRTVNSRTVYENIVDALSDEYFNLYYVDLETDDYIEYGSRTESGHHAAETRGKHFFDEARKNALKYIYAEDQAMFIAALDKNTLQDEIKRLGIFIMNYRLLVDGKPTYVNLKATCTGMDGRYIVIGVNNIDSQVKDREAAMRAREDRKAYLRFNALNNNLIVLYMVDPENDHYSEFVSSAGFEELGLKKEGDDFFGTTYRYSLELIHPEDQELFHSQVTKEKIMEAVGQDGIFVLDYRMIKGGAPSYVRMKASSFEEDGKTTLIIGVLDEDAQIRQEKKIADELSTAKRLATIDALTGVKNKNSFSEAGRRVDQRIADGTVSEFSVVVFDLNDLKVINDTRGHEAGDEYIREACRMICVCFKHSPVFRIGGDEFAAILEGEDYVNQDALLERFEKQVLTNMDRGKAVVSFGCSAFNPARDKSIHMVFERADAMMYKEKQLLKSLSSSDGDERYDRSVPSLDFGDTSSPQVRKHILIVDDIESNREILGELLQNDYEIMYASDGADAMEMLREHKDDIALVILDLYMPNMSGRDVMCAMQVDEELMSIPVIFISVDPYAESDCLKLGAMDFISKPYPDIEIIKARIDRCIELAENRDLIRRTQRDRLTGLFNIDYFMRYAERFDQNYKGAAFDAIVCSVNQFHALCEQYGDQFGNLVLRSIGNGIRKLARKTGGIGCRKESDTFQIYCPHQDNYGQLLENFYRDLFFEEEIKDKVALRFGIFLFAQDEEDIEERFACARIAADRAGRDGGQIYGIYEYSER